MLTSIGDIMREAHKRGWVTTRDGNISLRRKNSFYITPSGGRKTIIHPEFILKALIKKDGSLEWQENKYIKGTPSGELEMHHKLQITDYKKCRAIIHLHPTYIIAAMHAGWDLYKLARQFPEVSRYTKVGPNVPVLPVTSKALADMTHYSMTDGSDKIVYDIVGQAGHGVCAIGNSPWDAFEHVERLEHICQIVLASGVKPND